MAVCNPGRQPAPNLTVPAARPRTSSSQNREELDAYCASPPGCDTLLQPPELTKKGIPVLNHPPHLLDVPWEEKRSSLPVAACGERQVGKK